MKIKQIEVSGTHYEMGFKQGEIIADRVAGSFANFREYFHSIKKMTFVPLPYSIVFHLIGIIGRVKLKKVLKNLPHQLHRIEGLSAGTGKPLNWFLGAQFYEILAGEVSRYVQFASCTAVILPPDWTADKEMLLGKNYDFPYFLKDFQIVRVSKPKERYSSISLTQDILSGNHNGMNEHGLCVLYTYGYPAYDKGEGIPITILVEEILETCQTMNEAINFLKSVQRGNGASLGIADKNGDFCVVEVSPNFLEVRKEKDYIIHTNNYISPIMCKIDLPDSAVYKLKHPKLYGVSHNGSSRRRYHRAQEIVGENKGKFNFEKFEELFSDHKYEGESENNICRNGPLIGTLSSIIFSPLQKKVKVCYGNPCEGKFEIYNFIGGK